MDQSDKLIFVLIILFSSAAYILSRIPSLNHPDMHKRQITMKEFLRLFLIAVICLIIFTGFLFILFSFQDLISILNL